MSLYIDVSSTQLKLLLESQERNKEKFEGWTMDALLQQAIYEFWVKYGKEEKP